MSTPVQTKDLNGNTWTQHRLDDGKGNGVWSQVNFIIGADGRATVGYPLKPGKTRPGPGGSIFNTHTTKRMTVAEARAEWKRLVAEGWKVVE
jgi:hypothetical protein